MQMLYVHEAGGAHPEEFESINGITPPMRNARKRFFKPVKTPVADIASVEEDLTHILQVVTCRRMHPEQSAV